MENQQHEYEEISIKELIEILLKGKKTIILITLICLILASIYTFMIQKPIYESRTTLIATNASAKVQNVNIGNMKDYINTLSMQTINTLETYKQQVKSQEILENVIVKLKLDKENYTVDSLSNKISVSVIKDTNLIEISVKTDSPEMSKEIANAVTDEFINFLNKLNEKKVNQSVEFLKVKIDEQNKKLESSMKKYEEFIRKNNSLEVVSNELNVLLDSQKKYTVKLESLESDYQMNKLNNELKIDSERANLEVIEKIIEKLDNKIELNKTVMNEDLLREVFLESGFNINDISKINLKEETVNSVYYNLLTKKNESKIKLEAYIKNDKIIEEKYKRESVIIKSKIKDLTEKIENIQVKLAEMNHNNQLLLNELNNARSTYELLVNKYDEIKVTESIKVGEINLIINSKAFTPDNPISPNKKLNLAISLVLGLMIGVFIVFFMNMWKEEK